MAEGNVTDHFTISDSTFFGVDYGIFFDFPPESERMK